MSLVERGKLFFNLSSPRTVTVKVLSLCMEKFELEDGKVSLVLRCLDFNDNRLLVDDEPSKVGFPRSCLVNQINGYENGNFAPGV